VRVVLGVLGERGPQRPLLEQTRSSTRSERVRSASSAARFAALAPQRLYRSERECEEDYVEQREHLERTRRKYEEACAVLESERAALARGEAELSKLNDRSGVVAFMIKQLLREQGLQDEGAAAELVLKPQNSSPEIDAEIVRTIRAPIDHYFRDHGDITTYIDDKLAEIEGILDPPGGGAAAPPS